MRRFIFLCIVLCTGVAFEHDLKGAHEGSSFVLNQGETADAGDDAKAGDLTDSIQGLFNDAPAAPSATKKTKTSATKKTKPVATTQKHKTSAKPVALKVAKPAAKVPLQKVAFASQPKVAKVPEAAKKEVAQKPVAKKAVALKVVSKPPSTKRGKLVAKLSEKTKEKVVKAITENKAEKVVTKITKVVTVAKALATKLTKPIAKVQVAEKASQSIAAVPVTKLQVAEKAKAKAVSSSVKLAIPNTTQVMENKTKAIEEAVVSLPMASFALDIPKPVVNKTEQKFPGNATQKAAWEKRETDLEHQVETLKARLANASRVPDTSKSVSLAPSNVTGTLSPHLAEHSKKRKYEGEAELDKSLEKFMSPKKPVPVVEENKPKVEEPSVKPVAAAAPVAHHLVAPPQKKAVQVQEVKKKAQEQYESGAGNLEAERDDFAKSMESAIALHATVKHTTFEDSSVADSTASAASQPVLNPQASWWDYFRSFFWRSAAPAAISPKPVPVQAAALIDLIHKRGLKQDMIRTEQATRDESDHVIQVNDAWGQMERDDGVQEDEVRREDHAERERAETPEESRLPSKDELKGRHGADMSEFWSKLEHEDYGIERSVDNENLDEYENLIHQQTAQVTQAAEAMKDNKLKEYPALRHSDDKRLAIHEPWQRREERDVIAEQKVHDSPELQMLQLRHHHRRH